jgi:hypothetical protein
MHRALKVAENCIIIFQRDRARLWHPRLTNAWLGMTQPPMILEARGEIMQTGDISYARNVLSNAETLEGVAERRYSTTEDSPEDIRKQLSNSGIRGSLGSPEWLKSVCVELWNNRRTLKIRLSLSRFIRSIQHSSHLKHAFNNAACVSLLAIPAFMPSHSPGIYLTVYI